MSIKQETATKQVTVDVFVCDGCGATTTIGDAEDVGHSDEDIRFAQDVVGWCVVLPCSGKVKGKFGPGLHYCPSCSKARFTRY